MYIVCSRVNMETSIDLKKKSNLEKIRQINQKYIYLNVMLCYSGRARILMCFS